MAQVMVNFRMDEDVKRRMERACREMGLSMTTAFTIFATKVGKEKRIPFEITANPSAPEEPERQDPGVEALVRRRERLEELCAGIRRSLTRIQTAVPAAMPGLAIQQVRLLCADELKDKTAAAANAFRSVLSDRAMEGLRDKDPGVLDEYAGALSAIAAELEDMENTLAPALRAWSGGEGEADLAPYVRRLTDVSRQFDQLQAILRRFAQSAAPRPGDVRSVRARLRRAAAAVSAPEVRAALEDLDGLVQRRYDDLGRRDRAYLESFYLQTLEQVLEELARAERSGEGAAEKAALGLRVIHVLSQVVTTGSRTRHELSARSLEAEVVALERIAAMRGDTAAGSPVAAGPPAAAGPGLAGNDRP